jgi:Concanavalin A-like lectin/glucanases superfamily
MDSKIVIVALCVFVIILLYFLYQYSNASTIASYTTLQQQQSDVSITNSPSSLRYAVGVWIYVNSWANTAKPIINIPSIMSLSLDTTTPSLLFTNNITGASPSSITVTDNFPLQKWTYVTVSADSNYLDFYLDGKMVKSVYLQTTSNGVLTTPPVTNVVQIGKTSSSASVQSDIMIAQLYRWPNPLSPQDVWNEYLKGNGQSYWSGSTKYGLNMQLMKNNANAYSFKLF